MVGGAREDARVKKNPGVTGDGREESSHRGEPAGPSAAVREQLCEQGR